MECCFRCEKNEKETRLLDAIYENDIVKICERCAVVEDIPIIRKPTTSQLREVERSQTVYQRLKRMSGEDEKKKKHESILDKIRKLDEHPELEKPEEKKPFNLIDNFHWYVARARRNRGLSQKQLAWALGESETAIKMIEKRELPEDPEKFIRKIEQFFQIKIRERSYEEVEVEKRRAEEKRKFRLPTSEKLEEAGQKIEAEPIKPIVQEPEVDELDIIDVTSDRNVFEEIEETEKKSSPTQILTFKPEVMKNLTVADLKEMKEEREREERLLALEEERKKALQAESIVKELEAEERRKKELRERIAGEMKDIALGKQKKESVREKREMLNSALGKMSEIGTEKKEKEHVPTIWELAEKKKEKPEKMTGDEIELEE